MTDDNLDLETLRARIRSLEAQLSQSAGRDSRRAQVTNALVGAGVQPAALSDALALFETSARLDADGTWSVGSLSRASLSRAVQKFLGDRPHFIGGDASDTGNVAAAPGFVAPRYANGNLVPQDEWTMEELMQAAGGWPGKQTPKLDPVTEADVMPQHVQLEAVKADNYATRNAALGKAVASDRRYTVAELEQMDQDELWQAAGPFPRG